MRAGIDCEGTRGNSRVKEIFTPDIFFWMVVTWVHTTVKTHQTEHLRSVYCVQTIHPFSKEEKDLFTLD